MSIFYSVANTPKAFISCNYTTFLARGRDDKASVHCFNALLPSDVSNATNDAKTPMACNRFVRSSCAQIAWPTVGENCSPKQLNTRKLLCLIQRVKWRLNDASLVEVINRVCVSSHPQLDFGTGEHRNQAPQDSNSVSIIHHVLASHTSRPSLPTRTPHPHQRPPLPPLLML